jgi:hypothetical protein
MVKFPLGMCARMLIRPRIYSLRFLQRQGNCYFLTKGICGMKFYELVDFYQWMENDQIVIDYDDAEEVVTRYLEKDS